MLVLGHVAQYLTALCVIKGKKKNEIILGMKSIEETGCKNNSNWLFT